MAQEHVPIHTITVPLLTVVLVGVWLIGTTFWLTFQFYATQAQIMDVKTEMKNVGQSLSVRITTLERDSTVRLMTEWTRANQELWCSRTEQKNPNWKCGELPSVSAIPGSKDFWQQGTYQQQPNEK